MPPAPMGARISYGPRFVPGLRSIGRTVLPHEAAFLRHIAHISEPVKVATASTNLMAPPTADGRNRLHVLLSRRLDEWETTTLIRAFKRAKVCLSLPNPVFVFVVKN